MSSTLTIDEIYDLVPEHLRDRVDEVRHDIENRLACVETVADILASQILGDEDQKVLEALRFDAINELADIMKGILPFPESDGNTDDESNLPISRAALIFTNGGIMIGDTFTPIFTRFRVSAAMPS